MAATEKKKGAKEKTPLMVKFAFFVVLCAAVLFHPTTILFAVCMIPTFVAAFVDRNAQKTLGITVGGLNFAGTLPAWFRLWEMGHTLEASLSLATMPSVLMVAYGGAAGGWFIYSNVTPFVANMLVRKNERRLRDIDKRQKELLRRWGDGVKG